MPRISLPIDIGYYESESLPLAAQSCINMYPQNPQTKGALNNGALFYTPGINSFTTIGGTSTVPTRGVYKFNDLLFTVSSNGYAYTISDSGTATQLTATGGTISGGSQPVVFADNGEVLVILVPGLAGYFHTAGASETVKINDATWNAYMAQTGGVRSVAFKDGRFAYCTYDEIFLGSLVTDVDKGTTFPALSFGTAEIKPDKNVALLNVKNELLVFGEESIEPFQTISSTDFPLQRIPGAAVEKGLTSYLGAVLFDNSYAYIGASANENFAIWKGASGGAQKISTSAIDTLLQSYTLGQLENIRAFTYSEGGSFFLCFNLPDTTIVYDATASFMQGRPVWHERQSSGTAWRVNDIVYVYGKNYCSDSLSYNIGEISKSYTDEYGGDITRTFSGVYLYNKGRHFYIPELELYCDMNSADTVKLEMSRDGGVTFDTIDTISPKLVWRRLGRVERSAVFRFTHTSDEEFNALSLEVDTSG